MLKVIYADIDLTTNEEQFTQINFIADSSHKTRNILDKIQQLPIVDTFKTLTEKEHQYLIQTFGPDWYFFLFSVDHIRYNADSVQQLKITQDIYDQNFIIKVLKSTHIQGKILPKCYWQYQVNKYNIQFTQHIQKEKTEKDKTDKLQNQKYNTYGDDLDIDIDEFQNTQGQQTFLDQIQDNLDIFDKVKIHQAVNDKTKIYVKNYIYFPSVSLTDTIQEIQNKCAIVLRKKQSKDQYFVMNSGDMNIYSLIYPLKYIYLSMEDKNIYKQIQKMKEVEAVQLMVKNTQNILNKKYFKFGQQSIMDMDKKNYKDYQIETLMIQTCSELIPFGEMYLYSNTNVFQRKHINQVELMKYIKLFYPYSPYITLSIKSDGYLQHVSNQIDFDPISMQFDRQIKKMTDMNIDYDYINKYFLKPYVQQTLSDVQFRLQYKDSKKTSFQEFKQQSISDVSHSLIFKVLELDSIFNLIVYKSEDQTLYKRRDKDHLEDILNENIQDILKVRKQLAIKGYISEQQYIDYNKIYKQKEKIDNVFHKFKSMDPPDQNNKRKYEFQIEIHKQTMFIDVKNNFNLLMDIYEFDVLIQLIIQYVAFNVNTQMEKDQINFDLIFDKHKIKFSTQNFKFLLRDYILNTYKKSVSLTEYNAKYSRFLQLFYRYFLIDGKGHIRFLKQDNYLSKRILYNKLIHLYNNTNATKQQLVNDFSEQLGIDQQFIKKLIDELDYKRQLKKSPNPLKYVSIKKNNVGIYISYNMFQGELKYRIQIKVSEFQIQEIYHILLFSHVFFTQFVFQGLHKDFVQECKQLHQKSTGRDLVMDFETVIGEEKMKQQSMQKFKIVDNVYYTSKCQGDRKPTIHTKEEAEQKGFKQIENNLLEKDGKKAFVVGDQVYMCNHQKYKHVGFLKFSSQCLPCCFVQDQLDNATDKTQQKIKKCLGFDVLSVSKYRKNTLLYIQTYNNKKIVKKISFLPDELDQLLNKKENIDIKNMYLKKSTGYIYLKARKRNDLIYTICKNISIIEDEFYNRLMKIQPKDFLLLKQRIGIKADKIDEIILEMKNQKDVSDYKLMQEILMIPGLIHSRRIILVVFNNDNYLRMLPFNNEYCSLMQDQKIYDDSQIIYLMQLTDEIISKTEDNVFGPQIHKHDIVDYYTFALIDKDDGNSNYLYTYLFNGIDQNILQYIQFIYKTYYQNVYNQYEFILSAGQSVQEQIIMNDQCTGLLINDTVYYMNQGCTIIPNNLLHIYSPKCKNKLVQQHDIIDLDSYLLKIKHNNKTMNIKAYPSYIVTSQDQKVKQYFLHLQYKIADQHQYELRDGNSYVVIQIKDGFKNKDIQIIKSDKEKGSSNMVYDLKYSAYIREARRSMMLQFHYTLQNNQKIKNIYLQCIKKNIPYLIQNKLLTVLIVKLVNPSMCKREYIQSIFPVELFDLLKPEHQQQTSYILENINKIEVQLAQYLSQLELQQMIMKDFNSIPIHQFTNCIKENDKKKSQQDLICDNGKTKITHELSIQCVKYINFVLKQNKDTVLDQDDNVKYYIRKDFIQGDQKIFNFIKNQDDVNIYLQDREGNFEPLKMQLQILIGTNAYALQVFEQYSIFNAIYLALFIQQIGITHISIKQIVILQQNNVNIFVNDFTKWIEMNYGKQDGHEGNRSIVIDNINKDQIFQMINSLKILNVIVKKNQFDEIKTIVKLIDAFLNIQIQYIDYKEKQQHVQQVTYLDGKKISQQVRTRPTFLTRFDHDKGTILTYVIIYDNLK